MKKRDIDRLVRKNGFVPLRQKKHKVWKHNKTDRRLITSTSPSDINAYKHIKRNIMSIVGKERYVSL